MTTPGRLTIDGRDVAPLLTADNYFARLRGMLGTRPGDGALLLTRCNSVHGVGMSYRLDAALLDEDFLVLRTTVLHPFGLVAPRPRVRHVLEAAHGCFARWQLQPGCRLGVGPSA